LFRWCLESGLEVVHVMTLMSTGISAEWFAECERRGWKPNLTAVLSVLRGSASTRRRPLRRPDGTRTWWTFSGSALGVVSEAERAHAARLVHS
jgi:hypothetical protein